MDNSKPILGTTLYSFTTEWKMRAYTLDQIITNVVEKGLGPGVEIVGFQSFRSFPDVTDEFAENFKSKFEELGLIASCLGGNIDVGRRPGQDMTEDEMYEYIERQVVTAKKLGFPVLRIQAFIGPKMFEKLAPLAEKAEVQIACELHAPLTSDHPVVTGLMECYDKVGTPYLGFVPDFSSSMTQPPGVYWDSLRRVGGSEKLIDIVKETWHSDMPSSKKFSILGAAAAEFGASDELIGYMNRAVTMFGKMPPDGLRDLLPYTQHIHGKFYHVNEQGIEPSIPYPEIMSLLKDEGYEGTISAEWEGHAFTQESVGLQEVQAWHSMCNRLLAD